MQTITTYVLSQIALSKIYEWFHISLRSAIVLQQHIYFVSCGLSYDKCVFVLKPCLFYVYPGQIPHELCLIFVIFDDRTNVLTDLSHICRVDK
mgnify:CR=1 FL=1